MQNPGLLQQMREMGAKAIVALTPDHFFDYVADFPTIAPGQSATVAVRIDGNVHFIVDQLNAGFQLVAAFGTVLAGTPLPRTSAPGDAANVNTIPTMAHLRCIITTTDRPWTQLTTGVRMDILTGTGENGGWCPFKGAVAGNDSILVTVTNDAAVAVRGQVVFRGHKMPYQI